jgi:hypothetical protein
MPGADEPDRVSHLLTSELSRWINDISECRATQRVS